MVLPTCVLVVGLAVIVTRDGAPAPTARTIDAGAELERVRDEVERAIADDQLRLARQALARLKPVVTSDEAIERDRLARRLDACERLRAEANRFFAAAPEGIDGLCRGMDLLRESGDAADSPAHVFLSRWMQTQDTLLAALLARWYERLEAGDAVGARQAEAALSVVQGPSRTFEELAAGARAEHESALCLRDGQEQREGTGRALTGRWVLARARATGPLEAEVHADGAWTRAEVWLRDVAHDVALVRLARETLTRHDEVRLRPVPCPVRRAVDLRAAHGLTPNGPSAARVDVVLVAEVAPADVQRATSTALALLRADAVLAAYDPWVSYWSIEYSGRDEPLSEVDARGLLKVRRGLLRSALEAHDFPRDVTLVLSERAGRATAGDGVAACSLTDLDAVVHELGHALGGLRDEYDQDPDHPGHRDGSNLVLAASREEALARAPWKAWLTSDGAVDAFEVRSLEPSGRAWRATKSCRMLDEDDAFCVVCVEALVRRIHACVRPFADAAQDATLTLTASREERVRLDARVVHPGSHALALTWTVDAGVGARDVPDAWRTAEPSIVEVPARALSNGVLVTLEARDPTPWVRTGGPELAHRRRWRVDVQ